MDSVNIMDGDPTLSSSGANKFALARAKGQISGEAILRVGPGGGRQGRAANLGGVAAAPRHLSQLAILERFGVV